MSNLNIRFWLFLYCDILSILCSLFVLYHLLFNRTLRQSLIVIQMVNGVVFPCLYSNSLFAQLKPLYHQIIPTCIIIIFTISLLLRVLYQKIHLHQRILWRKQRKLTISMDIFFNYVIKLD
ncbi:unnamed protein product [Adineta steineri]|uniref:Uncharacterized protein n=1 Tax=Adineta steineri TaxID=433720 RepID=A0A819MVB8_9BILA|nr:unnamed protein product [Adineta steineri]CAF3986569.1 unnamed protein product [Adineta steineri]